MSPQREAVTVVTASAATEVHAALAALPEGRWLLAVSGGVDSMVLLDAFGSARPHEVAAVATFDHGTGRAAERAAALVVEVAEGAGLPVVMGERGKPRRGNHDSEAAWRADRWEFLGAWARELDATVVTAHTRDDQVETVVSRILRGAGVRGLAAMAASGRGPHGGSVVRPFLTLPKARLVAYAAERRLDFVEDPSNASLAFQRNRVRHELLPALERARPGFAAWCLDLSARAAALVARTDALLDDAGITVTDDGAVALPLARFEGISVDGWSHAFGAAAARIGLALDRRGLARAGAWAPRAAAGTHIPLSAGVRLDRTRTTFVLRPPAGRERRQGATVLY